MELREELFLNQDLGYKDFHKKLIPNISENRIIGVRVPMIRKIAGRAFRENLYNACEYYEERMIKGFCLAMKTCSVEEHIRDMQDFVPYIDCWATCDCVCSSLKFIKKDLDSYFDFVVSLINSEEYSTRFGVVILMDYYLTDEYIDRVLEILKNIDSEFYYINMAVAWALSVAYIKFPDKTEALFKSNTLTVWVQNKAIQKIRESNRIDKGTKQYLLQYKK